MKFKLYTDVHGFYSHLVETLKQAERSITMLYYEFHAGEWAGEISRILMEKQAAGVTVRLLVDGFGIFEIPPFQAVKNRMLIEELASAGIQVHIFNPQRSRTTYFNRLHFKVCAIDNQTLFLGGSNIADDYLNMQDLNLQADGDLGPVIEQIFEYLVQSGEPSSKISTVEYHPKVNLPSLFLENLKFRIVLTLPGNRQDVRRSLLGLILDSSETIYIKTWMFLPDREIVNALLHQLENGRRVRILLSDRTHVPFIDAANQIILHKLVRAGAEAWRYASGYMHAKASWNDQGTILFGSANLDRKALNSNYECSLLFNDPLIVSQLQANFEQDITQSYPVTSDTFTNQHWTRQAYAYLSSLLAAWL